MATALPVPSDTRDPHSEWAVETHGLTKRFGDNVAVNGVELVVPRGCAFGYLGPNGAGKTTLIRVLLGLTHADAGTMFVLGQSVPRHRDKALARVGAIVDEPRFHSHLTGRQNLQILAAAREPAARDRIGPSLERAGILHRADDKVSTYSMGMRQRLGVAACLLGDPELLILDEPMNGLDPAGMQDMREMIRSLVAEGRTVVLVLAPARRGGADLRRRRHRGPRQCRASGTNRRAARGHVGRARSRMLRSRSSRGLLIGASGATEIATEPAGLRCHPASGDRERRDRRDQPGARRRRHRGAPALSAPSLARIVVPPGHESARGGAMTDAVRGCTRAPSRKPDHRGSWIPSEAMITTRFMELRKRRGLMITLVLVTIGMPTVFLAVRLLLHALAPKTYGPAGGYSVYTAFVAGVLYVFGFIVAATLGVTAGSADLTEGMFRHLVVTGRSRLALYLARIPAGLAIIVPLVAVGFAIVCAVCLLAAPTHLEVNGVSVPANLSRAGLESWAADHADEVICNFDLRVGPSSSLTGPSFSIEAVLNTVQCPNRGLGPGVARPSESIPRADQGRGNRDRRRGLSRLRPTVPVAVGVADDQERACGSNSKRSSGSSSDSGSAR